MSAYLMTRGEGNPPVYRQIRDALITEIQELYSPGKPLPSEEQLAKRFGVNRHTLRRAVDELVADGFVERQHGKGVFVLEPAINYAIGTNTRFTETLESQGKTTESRVIKKLMLPARGNMASRLQLQEGTDVIFIETLREVEGKPFCVSSHFLPLHVCHRVLDSYQGGSLHYFLHTQCDITLKRHESLISAVLPESDDASLLKMARQAPLLRVKSLNVNTQTGLPVEYVITRFRGDATQLSFQP